MQVEDKTDSLSRSPYGERGLKFVVGRNWGQGARSLSLRRAWIEIVGDGDDALHGQVALLTESVD